MPISFHFLDKITLSNRKGLKSYILNIFYNEKVLCKTLNIIMCSDEYLLEINKDFLKHDFYTDVISFNFSSDLNIIEGDVYISSNRIRENAKYFKQTVENELHRVMFHGILHFCGYKDKTKKDRIEIRMKENYYLNHYFVSRETRRKELNKN